MRVLAVIALLALALLSGAVYVENIRIVKVEGTISDTTLSAISRAIEEAPPNSAILILLNTPGGEAGPTLEIVRLIGNSRVPVISFVYPDFSYAWSAGTYILLSSHVAAMTPHSVIGSCQPIQLLPTGEVIPAPNKTVNALAEYLRAAVKAYGRNATFAEACIRRNVNVNGDDAYRWGIIDFVARDVDDLLRQVNGTEIYIMGRWERLVISGNYVVEDLEFSPGERIAAFLKDPVVASIIVQVAFLLLLVGLFTGNPIIAVVAILLIVVMSLTALPLNVFGVAMLVLGALLILGELLSGFAAHGALSIAGAVLAGIGLVITMPLTGGEWAIRIEDPTPILASLYANIGLLVGLVAFMMYKIVRVHRTRPVSEGLLLNMVGKTGTASDNIAAGGEGYVYVEGEYWRATARRDVRRGQRVRVVDVGEGGILTVEPLE